MLGNQIRRSMVTFGIWVCTGTKEHLNFKLFANLIFGLLYFSFQPRGSGHNNSNVCWNSLTILKKEKENKIKNITLEFRLYLTR